MGLDWIRKIRTGEDFHVFFGRESGMESTRAKVRVYGEDGFYVDSVSVDAVSGIVTISGNGRYKKVVLEDIVEPDIFRTEIGTDIVVERKEEGGDMILTEDLDKVFGGVSSKVEYITDVWYPDGNSYTSVKCEDGKIRILPYGAVGM